jgi:hypothetical protein
MLMLNSTNCLQPSIKLQLRYILCIEAVPMQDSPKRYGRVLQSSPPVSLFIVSAVFHCIRFPQKTSHIAAGCYLGLNLKPYPMRALKIIF